MPEEKQPQDLHVFKTLPPNQWKQMLQSMCQHYVEAQHKGPRFMLKSWAKKGIPRLDQSYVKARDHFLANNSIQTITVTYSVSKEGEKLIGFNLSNSIPVPLDSPAP